MKPIIVATIMTAAIVVIFSIPLQRTFEIHTENTENIAVVMIDNYFKERSMPLQGFGKKMFEEAEKNGIDWRLLPAIAVRESSGGKQACGNNPFGWASCRKPIGVFRSVEEAIETVARHLGGNATTTKRLYGNKNTKQKLETYNPPSVVPTYSKEVMGIMEKIGPEVLQ